MEWFEEVFSSAEIEELNYYSAKAIEEIGEPIKVDLTFTVEKAKDFVETAYRSQFDAGAAFKLASFCRYLAGGVQAKIEEREDGTD